MMSQLLRHAPDACLFIHFIIFSSLRTKGFFTVSMDELLCAPRVFLPSVEGFAHSQRREDWHKHTYLSGFMPRSQVHHPPQTMKLIKFV
jgi:hypothetical protein